jgi:hypothetical protein
MQPLEAPDRPLADVHELEHAHADRGVPDQARDVVPQGAGELERRRVARAAREEELAAAAMGAGARRVAAAGSPDGDFRAVAPPVMSFAQGRRR